MRWIANPVQVGLTPTLASKYVACNGLTRFLAVEVTGVIILRTILVPGGNVA